MPKIAVLLIACFVASVTQARAGGQDFTLVNNTGFVIHSVYLSPHGADEWDEDILGRATLPSGEHAEIKFDRSAKAKAWDFRVADQSGEEFVWESIDLLAVAKVTLEYKDGKVSGVYE